MTDWTRERLLRALSGRDPAETRALVRDLEQPILVARALLFRNKPWLAVRVDRTKEDDLQAAYEYLFRDGARVLRKFGEAVDFVHKEGALQRFVIGVTLRSLQKLCRRRVLAWELLETDMASAEHDAGPRLGLLERILDFERAVDSLANSDRELLEHIYVTHQSQDEICQKLAISSPAFQQRKSRLLKRLAQFIQGKTGKDLGRGEST